jgi:hypothetical protein
MRSVAALLLLTSLCAAAPRRPPRAALQRPPLIEAPAPAIIAPPAPTTTVIVEQKRRWGLFGGGLALFLVGYAANIGVAYGVPNSNPGHAFIPLVGPLVQMGDKFAIEVPAPTGNAQVDQMITTRAAEVNGTIQNAAYAVLAIDFAMQLAGLTMAIVGAATKTTSVTYEKSPPLGRSSVQWSIIRGPTGGSAVALRF